MLCVHACVHLPVRTCAHACPCTSMCTRVPVCECKHARVSVCLRVCTRVPTCVCTCARVHECGSGACVCACMDTCVPTCTHMYSACIWVCTRVSLCAHACICVHVCPCVCLCVCMCEKPRQNLLGPSGPSSGQIPGDTVESEESVHRLGRASADEGQCVSGARQCESVLEESGGAPRVGSLGLGGRSMLSCRCGLCLVGCGGAAERLWAAKQEECDSALQPACLPFLRFLSRSEPASPASSDRVRAAVLCSQEAGGPWSQGGPHSAPCHAGPPVPPSWGPD